MTWEGSMWPVKFNVMGSRAEAIAARAATKGIIAVGTFILANLELMEKKRDKACWILLDYE
jgi:hypothetical protein